MKSLVVHHDSHVTAPASTIDPHQDSFSKAFLGFWIYLMSDCLIFACLFVTYALFQKSIFGGPSSKDLFELKTAFIETFLLLSSSVSCGFGVIAAGKNKRAQMFIWLFLTFLLGASFVGIELSEFLTFVHEGYSWQTSAFLSSFFALVGTHGAHVSFGLLWLFVMLGQLLFQGVSSDTFRRLVLFALFWHFLDLIWIFIFTFVYLIGVI